MNNGLYETVWFNRAVFFIHERHTERRAEKEAGSMQEVRVGLGSVQSPSLCNHSTLTPNPNNHFLKKIFIYLFIRDIERSRDRGRGRSRLCGEPYVGFDPRTPRSHPGMRQALNH